MYGEAGITAAPRANKPLETISTINQDTINCLRGCLEGLNKLRAKVKGPEPSDTGNAPEEIAYLLGDAKKINMLAYAVADQMKQLHSLIGHD